MNQTITYSNAVKVELSIYAIPANIPKIKAAIDQGLEVTFTNSSYEGPDQKIIFDGGIDFRRKSFDVKKAQDNNKCLIKYKNSIYQYAKITT